jgi:hypothetical protein
MIRIHIDDWLAETDDGSDPVLKQVKEWFEHFRLPAYKQQRAWLNARKLFCTYNEKRYRCTGCSRLGDVWLTQSLNNEVGYELRVDVAACSEWEIQVETKLYHFCAMYSNEGYSQTHTSGTLTVPECMSHADYDRVLTQIVDNINSNKSPSLKIDKCQVIITSLTIIGG